MASNKLIFVVTTEGNIAKAKALGIHVLKIKLASCVSYREVISNYWWENDLETSNEIQILFKTRKEKLNEILKVIALKHSYKLPELCYWEVSASAEYKNWVDEIINL